MQVVGHFLQMEAVRIPGADRDLYARSAYNRYYYAVFLSTRRMFSAIDADWASLAHKSYPEVLKGRIAKELKKARSRAQRTEDSELQMLIETALRAASALANLIEKAYGVRVVADYEPAEQVQFSSATRFSLKAVEITDAHNWHSNTEIWTLAITKAWAQLNA